MRRSFLQIFCLFWLCVVYEVAAGHSVIASTEREAAAQAKHDTMVEMALRQAGELQLAQHETWLALLHFKRETVLQRFNSQVDDRYFFLDDNGNKDAAAELNADIVAFLSSEKVSQKEALGEVHAQCLFPARWWWLKQQLDLLESYDVACPKLDVFMARVAHEKLFLVFPSMYLNNPGSTFGHTFLRFDSSDESILLSQTLNYAARVDEHDDIVSYVTKGLSGGYPGFFRARPYFETVQEYSNIENRDIWEYQLSFSADEIQQLVRHIWEVKGIDFDYYFFRENCAYRILALLDVIRPEMRLTSEGKFSVYAIPVDTVRALDAIGLVQARNFRASLATQIDDVFSRQPADETGLVLKLVSEQTAADKNSIAALLSSMDSAAGKMKILNQSYTVLQFYHKASTKKAQNILALSNELHSLNNNLFDVEEITSVTDKVSPEKGHGSMRIAAGYGEQNNNEYLDLRFRPAFHDLLDAPQGFVDGAAINVFDLRLKWFRSDSLRLESLSVFNVSSLTPLSRWQTPVSWLFDFSFDRSQLSDTESARNFISRGGIGFSVKQKTFMPFILLMGEWNLSSSYDKGYSLLLGVQTGLRLAFKQSQLLLRYEVDNAVSGFELDKKVSQLQWQYNLTIDHALRLSYKRSAYDFYNDEDWSLNYNYYF